MVTKMGGGYRYLESRIETTFFFHRHKKWQLLPWLYICGPIMTYVTLPVTDEWSHLGRFSAESDIITSAIILQNSINKARTNQITCTAALYKTLQDVSVRCTLLPVWYTSRGHFDSETTFTCWTTAQLWQVRLTVLPTNLWISTVHTW